MRHALAGSALALVSVAIGCGGAPAKAPAKPQAQADGACAEYAKRLCLELGARTESCRSVLSMTEIMPTAACQAGLDGFDATRDRIAELRRACQSVADNVCKELGEDSASCISIRTDLPEIPPGHCGALLRDQDRLIAMLRERQAADGPLSDAQWQALIAADAPSFGAADAAVVAVVFSDFQCPYCAEAAKVVERLKQAYSTRIRLVFRQYPLSFHPEANGAARAALAAHEQGKFWEFHDLLFAHQETLSAESMLAHARTLGLDIKAFETATKGEQTALRVAEDIELGDSVKVRGTPTLLIDRARIENPIDYEAVSQALEQALKPD